MERLKEIVIVYHFPCMDGAISALNVYLYYKKINKGNYTFTFIPTLNTDDCFENIPKRTIYQIVICDLSLEDKDLSYIIKDHFKTKILLFDHHIGWIEIYKKLLKYQNDWKNRAEIIYDTKNQNSACFLTLIYYYKKALLKITKEEFFKIYPSNYIELNKYVEDNDTGNFKIHNSRAYYSGLMRYIPKPYKNLNFKDENIFCITSRKMLNINKDLTLNSGNNELIKIKNEVQEELMENKEIYLIKLKKEQMFLCCFTNKFYLRNFLCPLLGKISQEKGYLPIGSIYYKKIYSPYKISMRTARNGVYDCSKIATSYGGGGHADASAFKCDLSLFNKFIVKKEYIAPYVKKYIKDI